MLRAATEADVDTIRRLRNQQANRDVSITSHEITADEHAAWWAKASVDPTRRVLIYQRDDEIAGVVTFFDLDGSTGAWGFFLDADGLGERGETLPAWIGVMREATAYAFDKLGLEVLTGEVLEHNTVVRQMNRRFRFVEGTPEVRYADGRELTVIPISLRQQDRRQGSK
jgi:RimJ/RimL family protein N-acetyltransferase